MPMVCCRARFAERGSYRVAARSCSSPTKYASMTVYEPTVLSFYNRESNASIIETQCSSAWHYTTVRITWSTIARDYANNKLAVGCTMHETFRRFNVPASNASPLYRHRNKDNREILAARTSVIIHSSQLSLFNSHIFPDL